MKKISISLLLFLIHSFVRSVVRSLIHSFLASFLPSFLPSLIEQDQIDTLNQIGDFTPRSCGCPLFGRSPGEEPAPHFVPALLFSAADATLSIAEHGKKEVVVL